MDRIKRRDSELPERKKGDAKCEIYCEMECGELKLRGRSRQKETGVFWREFS